MANFLSLSSFSLLLLFTNPKVFCGIGYSVAVEYIGRVLFATKSQDEPFFSIQTTYYYHSYYQHPRNVLNYTIFPVILGGNYSKL